MHLDRIGGDPHVGETGRLRGTEAPDLDLAARLSLGLTLVLIKNKIKTFGDA